MKTRVIIFVLLVFGFINFVQAQDTTGARARCVQFGFKENTKDHEECVKQFLQASGSKQVLKPSSPTKPAAASLTPTVAEVQKEDKYWSDAKMIGNRAAFEAYLKLYPNGSYAELARAKVTQLDDISAVATTTFKTTNSDGKLPACTGDFATNNWTDCLGNKSYDEGTYIGSFKSNLRNGSGSYTFNDGGKYIGEFTDGNINGQGKFEYVDGTTYIGQFKDGLRNGYGLGIGVDGSKYNGNWIAGNLNGIGTTIFANGNQYVGEYKDNLYDGQGTFTYKDGSKYSGQFKGNQYEGQGTFTYKDGSKYIGQFKDSQYEGQGTLIWASGDKYIGNFVKDKRTGQGRYFWASGISYVGEFKENKLNGYGTLFDAQSKVIHTGRWLDDKRSP